MNEKILLRGPEESIDDYLWRLGSMKDAGVINLTWPEIASLMNGEIQDTHAPMDESRWRKRYRRLRLDNATDINSPNIFAMVNNPNNVEEIALQEKDPTPESNYQVETPSFEIDEKALLGEKIKIQVRDERSALNRKIRNEARYDALMDLFKSEIRRYNAVQIPKPKTPVFGKKKNQAIYAMLSDIHYGLAFKETAGTYNSSIAKSRVMNYADEIADIGELHDIDCCYVSLLGDMISGIIHNTIRMENKENIVEQVVGVSELIASFLYELSGKFTEVHVNAVSGNHSRVDLCADDAPRDDKLDALIPYICKIKLEKCSNVIWHDNEIDTTISNYHILGVHYVSVHGDYDKNLNDSAVKIGYMIREPVDYILAGHMHVPEMRLGTIGIIRNGSVCGSGDEYTSRKRLYSKPYQVCMIVDETGVKDIIPVEL